MTALLVVAAMTLLPGTPLTRCDGETEVCRNDAAVPWPDADMPALCAARQVFCQDDWIDARPAEVAGYRAGDPVGNRGPVTDAALWAIVDHFPASRWRRAVLVMACESAFDRLPDNPKSSAAGPYAWLRDDFLWYTADVMGEPLPAAARYDMDVASRVTAHRVSREDGWGGWSCEGWTP